jgi:CDP-glycerol glycerophosphotransferase (TagB/SpsB family)
VDADGGLVDPVVAIAELARACGVDVVVKPHPLDADRYARSGLRVVTTEEVLEAGMSLYQLIGAADGMISDYSSVWVEFLGLDRPLLLYCPDLSEYAEGRGLNEPYMTEVAAGLIVERVDELRAFLEAVRDGRDWRPDARAATHAHLQLPPPGSPAPLSLPEVVLEELGRRNVGMGVVRD